jgi:hypothetical protein
LATAVRVEAAVPGRRRAGTAEHPVDLDVAAGSVPLRSLIDAVVRSEVKAFQDRAERRAFLRVLTEQSLAEGLAAGAVRGGGVEPQADVDPDAAVATALEAHADGLYRVLVDDEPVDSLDAAVVVGPGTRLLFLRLVALAGG